MIADYDRPTALPVVQQRIVLTNQAERQEGHAAYPTVLKGYLFWPKYGME